MKSKFKISVLVPIFGFFLTSGLIIEIIFIIFKNAFTTSLAEILIVTLLFLLLFIFFTEIKQRILKITFEKNNFILNRFYGLGTSNKINDIEIEGFHKSILSTKYGRYNYIYLIKGNKKIAKISNQYHKNFGDLSREIEKRYKNLGFINSNFISELKDIF